MLEFTAYYFCITVDLTLISGGDKINGYFFRSVIYFNVNILVSFDHHSNIIAAALELEGLFIRF